MDDTRNAYEVLPSLPLNAIAELLNETDFQNFIGQSMEVRNRFSSEQITSRLSAQVLPLVAVHLSASDVLSVRTCSKELNSKLAAVGIQNVLSNNDNGFKLEKKMLRAGLADLRMLVEIRQSISHIPSFARCICLLGREEDINGDYEDFTVQLSASLSSVGQEVRIFHLDFSDEVAPPNITQLRSLIGTIIRDCTQLAQLSVALKTNLSIPDDIQGGGQIGYYTVSSSLKQLSINAIGCAPNFIRELIAAFANDLEKISFPFQLAGRNSLDFSLPVQMQSLSELVISGIPQDRAVSWLDSRILSSVEVELEELEEPVNTYEVLQVWTTSYPTLCNFKLKVPDEQAGTIYSHNRHFSFNMETFRTIQTIELVNVSSFQISLLLMLPNLRTFRMLESQTATPQNQVVERQVEGMEVDEEHVVVAVELPPEMAVEEEMEEEDIVGGAVGGRIEPPGELRLENGNLQLNFEQHDYHVMRLELDVFEQLWRVPSASQELFIRTPSQMSSVIDLSQYTGGDNDTEFMPLSAGPKMDQFMQPLPETRTRSSIGKHEETVEMEEETEYFDVIIRSAEAITLHPVWREIQSLRELSLRANENGTLRTFTASRHEALGEISYVIN